MAKTKVLRNKHVTQRPVIVGGSVIEEVHSYIYLVVIVIVIVIYGIATADGLSIT